MKKRIILTLAAVIALLISSFSYAQFRYLVEGHVYEAATGGPVAGATVTVLDTVQKTVTDIDGYFRLIGNGKGYTLQISYVGFKTKTLKITDSYMVFKRIELEEEDGTL